MASFRIPKALKLKIEEWLAEHPVTGCKSACQYLRKLAIDRFAEPQLLAYANPEDDKASPEIAAAKRKILAAQPPAAKG